jgi:hypothetical protein
MTLKHLFFLVAAAWILLWVLSGLSIAFMGHAFLLIYLGIALLPPALLYLFLFHLLPTIIKRRRLD